MTNQTNFQTLDLDYFKQIAERVKAERALERAEALKKKVEPKPEAQESEEAPTIITPSNSKYFHLTEEMYKEALGRIKKDYGNNATLLKVQWDAQGKVAKGSNSYYVALINTIFRNQGIRTATQADLEEILRDGALSLNGTYEDSGIVLRSLTAPNEYLAKQVGEQIAKIQGKKVGKLQLPIYVPASGLELNLDADSPSKLGFKVLDNAELIYAPILNPQSGSNFSNLDIDAKTGMPKKIGAGNRTLYTRADGLSRVYLDGGLDLNSSDDDLGDSIGNGRVICASAPQGASA